MNPLVDGQAPVRQGYTFRLGQTPTELEIASPLNDVPHFFIAVIKDLVPKPEGENFRGSGPASRVNVRHIEKRTRTHIFSMRGLLMAILAPPKANMKSGSCKLTLSLGLPICHISSGL